MTKEEGKQREKVIIKGVTLFSEIIHGDSTEYALIDNHHKFIGVDHDLWEFQAILFRVSDGKYFSTVWEDGYHALSEYFDESNTWELLEVYPRQIEITQYI